MPAPPIVDESLFGDAIALPPPLPLLTSCRESRSAPLYQQSFLAPTAASYCELLAEPGLAGEADASSEAIVLTSPAATYKEQGREISGLCRAFSRPSVPLAADSRLQWQRRGAAAGKPLPRHPPLVPSKSSPALHRSPSKSPPPLPSHKEEPLDVSAQHEDKQYSPSDCTTLLSSSTGSTSVSALASSPSASSPLYYCASSSTTVLAPSTYRSLSAHSASSQSAAIDQLSAHVNPFHTQAGHRSLPATHSVGNRRRRVTDSRKDYSGDGRTASTASTCSMASSSLSTLTSPSFGRGRTRCFAHDGNDNDADIDSDSDSNDGDDEDSPTSHRSPSHSPPSHFTFPAALTLRASASFSSSSSSSTLCFSPHSPLFDTSLSGGRHSADPQFSAGIGVFAGQLQALRRMRSANAVPSPVHDSATNEHRSSSSRSQTSH